MLEQLGEINWIAVVVATLAVSFLGGLWFVVLFGKAYANALGREYNPKEKPAPIFIIGPLVCTFVSTITSAVLIYSLNLQSVAQALSFGLLVGIGYLASTTVNTAINPNMPRPLFYGLISGSYFFLASIISSLILFFMK